MKGIKDPNRTSFMFSKNALRVVNLMLFLIGTYCFAMASLGEPKWLSMGYFCIMSNIWGMVNDK